MKLTVALLSLLSYIIILSGCEESSPYHETNLKTLRQAQPDTLILCVIETSIKRAVFVEKNDENSLLYGYEFSMLSIQHIDSGISYASFDDCEVRVLKNKAAWSGIIGSIIVNGLQ